MAREATDGAARPLSTTSVATPTKWVYLFEEGSASMRTLLGGKGAGCAEMTRAGLPVPPGFTITTEACNTFYSQGKAFPPGMWEQALEALKTLEQKTGKRFGDATNPLLVSVRSGAAFSMPGMMDTVLNLGLNDDSVLGLARLTQNERFAQDAYRRFVQMYGRIVLGIDSRQFDEALDAIKKSHGAQLDTDLDTDALKEVVAAFKQVVERETNGKPFPDPIGQLSQAIMAVFSSWMGDRAVVYRNANKIPHDLGTAVNVQTMVFGNMGGGDSGTGVAFTRNPSTGVREVYGDFLLNAQGEDVVAGIRTPMPISQLNSVLPDVYRRFTEIADRLERTYRDVQDLEFTVERGQLYMLQTRTAQRTAAAAVKIAVDMVREGVITQEEALQRVQPDHIVQLLLPQFDPTAKLQAVRDGRLLVTGISASPGAAYGKAILDAGRADELGSSGEKVILVRPETSPDDVHGMIPAQGVLTARGGKTSHAAVVARGMGKPAVVGAEGLLVDPERRTIRVGDRLVREGDWISIDGATGEVFLGEIPSIPPKIEEQGDLVELLGWADQIKRLQVWANADYPRDAERARAFGAQGIGLCRTEHMFMEQERLPIVQQMILAAPDAARTDREVARLRAEVEDAPSGRRSEIERRLKQAEIQRDQAQAPFVDALTQLLPIQRGDFKGILRAMDGLPVVIRLLDPPLHEFLPDHEGLLLQVAELRRNGDPASELADKETMLQAVEGLRERNPMLGLRGCRLGLCFPGINEMQVRAIFEAAAELKKEGLNPKPEVMIPLVGHINELTRVRSQLEETAQKVMQEQGVRIEYKFGTMIEVPRAALTAAEIAQAAQFFSFGTNDLTQMTFAYSRDDAEGKFLTRYLDDKILAENPFQTIDVGGVGKLIRMAVEDGRRARPDLEVGVCGEHGGDPASIEFFNEVGLDYVSCSPFRVPVARLAAARAAATSKAYSTK
ncbi:MAG: pyruvate, phosphate dikinase [Chloroflexi bacterium]|nr:pyruvate, phosphate dikinase [Chloroflexota bacterium]